MLVSRFVVVKECDSAPIGEKVESQTDFGKARARSRVMGRKKQWIEG